MALNYSILSNKNVIKLKDISGNIQDCYDLLSINSKVDIPKNSEKCVVNKYYIARPDLISLAFYGTDNYADIICKVNGISNPFELNEDDMLDIPNISSLSGYSFTSKSSELIEDDSVINNDVKVNFQKNLNQKRSPAEQTIGDNNYIIDRSLGLVFY